MKRKLFPIFALLSMISGVGIIIHKTLGVDPESGEPLPVFEPVGLVGFCLLGLGLLLMAIALRLEKQAKVTPEAIAQPSVRRWPDPNGRVFKYRQHLFKATQSLPYVMAVFFLFGCVALWFFEETLIRIVIGGGTIFFILELYLIFFFYRRMTAIRVSIEGEDLIYQYHKGTERIPLKTITALTFPSVAYGGGWLKIVTPQRTIRLTVVLEDIGLFCRYLKGRLKVLNHLCYDELKFYRFQQLAVSSDLSWMRLYRFSRMGLLVILLADCLVAAVLLFLGWEGLSLYVAVGFGGVIPLVLMIVIEMGLARRIYEAVDEDSFAWLPFPPDFEKSVYIKGLLCGFVLQLFFVIVLILSRL